MEKKNVTEVVIDGKIYKLGGYESEEYLHQVASYLNNKITELKGLDGYNHLSSGLKGLMLDLNTADDYFKARKQADRLQNELSEKDKELYEVKHELVSLQVRQEDSSRHIFSLREEISDYQKRIVELEARLRHAGLEIWNGESDEGLSAARASDEQVSDVQASVEQASDERVSEEQAFEELERRAEGFGEKLSLKKYALEAGEETELSADADEPGEEKELLPSEEEIQLSAEVEDGLSDLEEQDISAAPVISLEKKSEGTDQQKKSTLNSSEKKWPNRNKGKNRKKH